MSASRQGTQTILVLVEVAMTLVLLVGAGLMIRSLTALWRVDPGFRADNVLTFGLTLPTSTFHANADTVRAALRQSDEAMESAPGVQAVSLSWGASVSYTHLDVYKRQGLGCPAFQKSSSSSPLIGNAPQDKDTAVSYTHLDVYKRQCPYRSTTRNEMSLADALTSAGQNFWITWRRTTFLIV